MMKPVKPSTPPHSTRPLWPKSRRRQNQRRQSQRRGSPLILLEAIALLLLLPLVIVKLPLLFDPLGLTRALSRYGLWAGSIFVLLHFVATLLGIPGVILTIVGGAVFGLYWGTALSWLGTTLGAMGAFWLARTLFHPWAERRFGHHPLHQKFTQAVQRQPLSFVLMVRFAPINPFNVVNFLLGLTQLHWWPYCLGTGLGIVPGVIVYTWLGVTGQQAIQGEHLGSFWFACGVLTILSGAPWLYQRWRQRTVAQAAAQTAAQKTALRQKHSAEINGSSKPTYPKSRV